MNNFLNQLKENTNYMTTENGALAHKSTNSAVYDLFALGGAYRKRSDADICVLVDNAIKEDPDLAMKCLFYLRDIRGGQGERRFFRVAMRYLSDKYPAYVKLVLDQISEFGRWDDLIYLWDGTEYKPIKDKAFNIILTQLFLDSRSKTPSLLGKWMPSENACSKETKRIANALRKRLQLSHKAYRKMLSSLRQKINIVERLMSENRWDEIEFEKIPSRAGLIYKNAFARRDIIAEKYARFAKDKSKKVNASVSYPYEVVAAATKHMGDYCGFRIDETERNMINKYWENIPDYLKGKTASMMAVVDTSGSMTGQAASAPINVAISLGMYLAERLEGPYKNHYISFSAHPQLIKVEGIDFVDKVHRIYKTNLCENTDLIATFDLLLRTALESGHPEQMPETLIVISDMQIDEGSRQFRQFGYRRSDFKYEYWTEETAKTEMETVRKKFEAHGLKMPRLIYWNVDARENTILDSGPNVSFVSGMSPVIFEAILTGKNGYDLMLEKLLSDRYKAISLV